MSGEERGGEAFEERARRLLADGAAELDAPTRARLAAARARALQAAERPARAFGRAAWLAPAAAAVAVAAVWLGLSGGGSDRMPGEQMAALGDLELLLELDLVDELEFYDWLEQQPELRTAIDGAG